MDTLGRVQKFKERMSQKKPITKKKKRVKK